MGSGSLLALGLMLGAGCASEDPATQTDFDAMITTGQPGAVLDAQVASSSDAGTPGPNDAEVRADAGNLTDAAVPRSDAGRDGSTGAVPIDASAPGADAQGQPSAAEVCARWKADRADLKEGTWGGSVDTCTAGETPPEAATNGLRLFNLYRGLAGLAPFAADAEANRRAQACALLMAANGTISHEVPTTWKCYTAEAAATAASSSLATGPSVSSVDAYVLDPGNPTTLGHRRWVFSASLASVGFGSAGRFSCQYQPPRGAAAGAKPWIAWPAPGQMPFQVFKQARGSLDTLGWSIQSDSINLQAAQVSVMSAGKALPVTVTQLLTGYGSRYAIRFVPMGWTTEAGATYEVSITGTSTPITYSVEVVNCAP
jgi:uncharacterized protein YkwD